MKKLLFLFIFFCTKGFTQNVDRLFFTAHYLYQLPQSDLKSFYSNNSNVGAGLVLKLKSHFTFGIEGQYMFGSDYKDPTVIGSMMTTNGFIIGNDLTVEQISVEGRGGNFKVELGRVFPNSKATNKQNGIHIKAGLGYMFYSAFINIDDNKYSQLKSEYAEGYSRLQSGLSFNGFIGYAVFSQNRMVNGSLGIETVFSSMKLNGNIDFGTGKSIEKAPISSLLIGPKLTMMISLKTFGNKSNGPSDGFYYN